MQRRRTRKQASLHARSVGRLCCRAGPRRRSSRAQASVRTWAAGGWRARLLSPLLGPLLPLLRPALMIRHLMRQQYRVTKQHVLPLDRAPHLFLRYRRAQLPQHEPALRRIFLFRYRQHVRASPSVAVCRALVEDRQHPLQLVPPPARQARYLDDVAAVMDALHQRVARLQLPPRAPLGHSRADVDHRLVRQAQVVAHEGTGFHSTVRSISFTTPPPDRASRRGGMPPTTLNCVRTAVIWVPFSCGSNGKTYVVSR